MQVTSPNRIPFLLTGKADLVMASFSVTDERKKVIDFSDPYGVIQIVVAAPKSVAIKDIKDLVGKRLGTTRGSSNDKEATTQAQGAEMVRYDDDATLITGAGVRPGEHDGLLTAGDGGGVNARRPNDPLEIKLVLKTNPYAAGSAQGRRCAARGCQQGVIATNLKTAS